MLRLTEVTLSYPDGDRRLTALDAVDLTVAGGEYAAITGPSGSGKSSLLAVAATLVTPDRGTVELGDALATGISRRRAAALRRSKLGIVFQSPNLIPSLTVREQLEVVARMGAGRLPLHPRRALAARIDELLDEVGVLPLADRRPAQLSGGQRQRVNVARAIVHGPEVLLVDEPTSALDRERGEAIIALLGRVTRERGLATVVVTHELEHLPAFDRAYRMLDGRLTPLDAASPAGTAGESPAGTAGERAPALAGARVAVST